jgi:ABC-type transport system substrate-binding protein
MSKSVVFAVTIASVALLALLIATNGALALAQGSGALRLPSLEPVTLDPARMLWYQDVNIGSQVFAGLTQMDKSSAVTPSLAISWTNSPDARNWTFYLHDDAYFHNGRQVTAADVVYSWNRVQDLYIADPDNCPYCNFLDGVDSAATDTSTLVVTLTVGAMDFPALLTMPVFTVVPQESVSTIVTSPVGAGPYKFVSWTAGDRVALTANPAYFGGAPALANVEFVFYPMDPVGLNFPNAALQWPDYLAGKLDVSYIPTATWPTVSGDPGVVTGTMMVVRMLQFDAVKLPDVTVRQAFQMAVDRETVIDDPDLWGYNRPLPLAHGVVSPQKGAYDNHDLTITYNPTASLALLVTAGYTDTNHDGILEKEGTDLRVDIFVGPSTATQNQVIARLVAEDLGNIGGSGLGVSTTLTTTLGAANAYLVGWQSDYPDAYNDLSPFAAGQWYANRMHYNGVAFNAALTAARTIANEQDRNAGYHAAEAQLVITDAMVLPICYSFTLPLMAAPAVQGLRFQGIADGVVALSDVVKWSFVYLPLVVRGS